VYIVGVDASAGVADAVSWQQAFHHHWSSLWDAAAVDARLRLTAVVSRTCLSVLGDVVVFCHWSL